MTKQTLANWSFSALQVFETCKYRSKLARIDKIPDLQPKTAADRGTAIHQEAEDYVTGKGLFTHALRFFKVDLTSLKNHFQAGRVICEEEWAFDDQWNLSSWNDGWLRLKCDAVCFLDEKHLAVIDYKTGKRFGNEIKHADQLQLYAVCALLRHPEVERVTCELWYFDQNELATFTMKRSQLKKYLLNFDKRGQAFTNETEFKPSPNIVSCKYCPYHPTKQGDCIYGVTQEMTLPPKPVTYIQREVTTNALDLEMAAEAMALATLGDD